MKNFFGAIQTIAENRIAEAQKNGEFDNLPGAGRPLPEEDLSAIPDELRMAWRILKNSGYIPEEVANRKEIARLADLLESCPEEQLRLQSIHRLRALMDRMGSGRHALLVAQDEYYNKILALLEKHERMGN